MAGIISVAVIQKINLFNRIILAYLGSFTLIIALIIWYFTTLTQEKIGLLSSLAGNLFFSVSSSLSLFWQYEKVNVYESFIEGAKEGFTITIKIIPYLVAMLVAIGVFRTSGAMDFVIKAIGHGFAKAGINTDFVAALPTAFMKPLSGAGARGMMVAL